MNPSSAVESFDTSSGGWERKPDILSSPMFSGMVQKDGSIYVIGGLTANGDFINSVEIFDTEKNMWKNAAPLQSKRADMSVGKFLLLS